MEQDRQVVNVSLSAGFLVDGNHNRSAQVSGGLILKTSLGHLQQQ